MRKAALSGYTLSERKWAFIDAMNNGFTVKDTAVNPLCISWMCARIELYREAISNEPRAREVPVSTAVPSPDVVPPPPSQAPADIFAAIQDVGSLRGLYLVGDGGGGYTVTVKILHKSRGRVYRYGRLRDASQLGTLIRQWNREDRWTPDKT